MNKDSKAYGGLARSVLSAVAPAVARTVIGYINSAPKSQKLTRSSFGRAGLAPPTSSGNSRSSRSSRGSRTQKRSRRSKRGSSMPLRSKIYSMPAPVNEGDIICNDEAMFTCRPVTDRTHGPGCSVAFSALICPISTTGLVTTGNYLLPINIASAFAGLSSAPIGFVESTNNNSSGYPVHPLNINARLAREANNWTKWRPCRLRFRYQNSVSTSTNGALMMALTRDPCAFVEAGGSQTAPVISRINLANTIPNCTGNLYHDFSVRIDKFDKTLYPTEIAIGNFDTLTNNFANVAYLRELIPCRLAALFTGLTSGTAATFGNLWLDGEFEFFQPASNFLTTAVSVNPTGTPTLRLKVGSDEKVPDEKKVERPLTLSVTRTSAPTLGSSLPMGPPPLIRQTGSPDWTLLESGGLTGT